MLNLAQNPKYGHPVKTEPFAVVMVYKISLLTTNPLIQHPTRYNEVLDKKEILKYQGINVCDSIKFLFCKFIYIFSKATKI